MYHVLLIFLRDYTFQTFILCTMIKYFICLLIVIVYFKQYHLKLTHYKKLNNQNSEVKKTIRPCLYFKFKFIPYIYINKLVILFMFANFNNYKFNLILHILSNSVVHII